MALKVMMYGNVRTTSQTSYLVVAKNIMMAAEKMLEVILPLMMVAEMKLKANFLLKSE